MFFAECMDYYSLNFIEVPMGAQEKITKLGHRPEFRTMSHVLTILLRNKRLDLTSFLHTSVVVEGESGWFESRKAAFSSC